MLYSVNHALKQEMLIRPSGEGGGVRASTTGNAKDKKTSDVAGEVSISCFPQQDQLVLQETLLCFDLPVSSALMCPKLNPVDRDVLEIPGSHRVKISFFDQESVP